MTCDPTPPLDSGDAATPHTPSSASGAQRFEPRGPVRARDVVVFGREVGRVLSDGRIIGRAEPFAKVSASSREIKRAVGATATPLGQLGQVNEVAGLRASEDRQHLVGAKLT